jgi:NADH-quinone oxidoreductase subunit L
VGPGRFVCFFCAVWDPATGLLTYTNAGMDPPVLFRTGAEWRERLRKGGPVLGAAPAHPVDELLETIAVTAGVVGIAFAGILYMTGRDRLEFVKQALAPIYDLLYNKYYVDEIYDFLIVRPTKAIGAFLEEKAERQGIDFAVDEVGAQIHGVSRGIGLWQSGKVRTYALNMVAGLVVILLFVVFL